MERSDFMLKAPPSVPLALVGASQGPFLKITLWYLSCSIDTDERLGCFVPVQFFCDIGHHFSQFVLVFLEKGAKKKQYDGNVYFFHFWVFLYCCFVLTPVCSFSGWKHRHRRRDISRWTSERRVSPLSCLWSPTCRLGTCESAKVLIKKNNDSSAFSQTWLRLQTVTEGKKTSLRGPVVSLIEITGLCWNLMCNLRRASLLIT